MRSRFTRRWAIIFVTSLATGDPHSPAGPPSPANGSALLVPDCRISVFQEAVLAGELPGILHAVSVREGDRVSAAQVVAQIRDQSARTAFATAEKEAGNDIEQRFAEKASELATLEYTTALLLNKEFPGTHSDLHVKELRLAAERSLLQIEQASYRQELAQLRLVEAEALLESYRIVAPFDGIVTQVHKHRGEAIQSGEPVLEIANFDRMRVEGLIPLAESWRVQIGDSVSVRVRIPDVESPVEDMEFPGRIVFVDLKVQELSRIVRVWAEISNHNGWLKDGLTGAMRIDAGTASRPAAFGTDQFRSPARSRAPQHPGWSRAD